MSSTRNENCSCYFHFPPRPLPLPPPPTLVTVAARSIPNRSLSLVTAVHPSFHPFPSIPPVPIPPITWYAATTLLLWCSVQIHSNYSPFCLPPRFYFVPISSRFEEYSKKVSKGHKKRCPRLPSEVRNPTCPSSQLYSADEIFTLLAKHTHCFLS